MGTNTLTRIWSEAWRPPDRQPVWAWAEQHVAALPYSPLPGRFRIENSPQIREVLEAIVTPAIRQVCVIAAVQASKTLAGEIALCYVIANAPGPTLWLNETDEDAKDQSESRLQKLFDVCDPVRSLFPDNRHQKRNRTIHFANGMTLWMAGAHNKTNLQRRSIRWIFADECWAFPPGHMAEAEARVTAFGWLGKCVWMSQGGEEDDDIHRKFETTDMREWMFACPACEHFNGLCPRDPAELSRRSDSDELFVNGQRRRASNRRSHRHPEKCLSRRSPASQKLCPSRVASDLGRPRPKSLGSGPAAMA